MPPTAQQKKFVHPEAGHAKKKAPSPFGIEPISAFYLFLGANLVSALFAPIQDCDETFNYWEPAHYLSHGYGLQTWEYSPDFAIRSWLYVALHAAVGSVRRLLPRSTKPAEFYLVRYALALVCALCQTLLWRVVAATIHPRIGLFFILALALSPGNFHASTAFLPSSLAMYAAMLGAAAFMNWRGGLKTSRGIFWFAAGGIVGWPFAAALCAPFLLEEGVFALLGDRERFVEAVLRVLRGVGGALVVVTLDAGINTFFYRRFEIASWNIVKYNVFSATGGPELYGTEPWTFYFKNLALNFNLWFVLALLALPLFLAQKLFSRSAHGFQSGLRTLVFVAPFYLWLAIFTRQPHKEERFMYPAYPFLALNAAISLHILLVALGRLHRIPARLRLVGAVVPVALAVVTGLARIGGVYSAYAAPLALYEPLANVGAAGDNVCFGKEWYRFPSSYFLPHGMRAKFVRSEFRGLLPGEFAEARSGFGLWSGTWLPTAGLNDRNEEDAAKYVADPQRSCAFLVDTQYPEDTAEKPPLEPDYVADTEHWEKVVCLPFLDAARTHSLARTLWVPDWDVVPARFRRKWGRHCLLRGRGKAGKDQSEDV